MTNLPSATSDYRYSGSDHSHAHAYLLPTIEAELERFFSASKQSRRIFDLGCGNGSVAAYFANRGFEVNGVDPSTVGIAHANAAYPDLELSVGSAYDDLQAIQGAFPAVLSLEVVEHVYAPRDFAKTLSQLVSPGGIAVVSTPYHGYVKNIALAITGKMDEHFTALWDHGHIKFWSMKTLRQLLSEVGFVDIRFRRVGRFRTLAKSMIAIARKPVA